MKQVEPGMKQPVMLYKHPGPHLMGKGYYDYTIVDKCNEKAFDNALIDGWYLTMPEALENSTSSSVVETAKLEADKKAKAEAESKIVVEATAKAILDAENKETAEKAEKEAKDKAEKEIADKEAKNKTEKEAAEKAERDAKAAVEKSRQRRTSSR